MKKSSLCRDGEWQQLNANILQIENEYYSSVRPKQILQGEEKPSAGAGASAAWPIPRTALAGRQRL